MLTLAPAETVRVLRSDVDLRLPVSSNIVTPAASVSRPVTIEFDVTAP